MADAPPTPPFRLPADASERDLVAKLFRGLGDPIRLAVLELLEEHGELTVSALVAAIGEPQPKVSNHLAALRWCGYVETARSGRNVRYRIADARVPDLVARVRRLLRDHPQHGADLPPLPDVPAEADPGGGAAPDHAEPPPATAPPAAVPPAAVPLAAAPAGPALTLLAFRLGEGEYAVPVADVREVVRRLDTRGLPGLPADAVGVASHRGAVTQVRDLARRLGVDAGAERRAVLVVDAARGPVGWLVDRIAGLVVTDGPLAPPPLGGDALAGVAMDGDRVILVLAPHVLRG